VAASPSSPLTPTPNQFLSADQGINHHLKAPQRPPADFDLVLPDITLWP